jgi:Asp-tRNA(Asn)/Glu-tRNA(Gln) amidotransferase A subunit family amidase
MSELNWMGGHELALAIRQRKVSPVEAVDAALAQLEKVEPSINAFVTVTAEEVRAHAIRQESELMSRPADELPPLFGVPITVKDLTDTAGVRTTYGSRAFSDHVPTADGVNWSRLKAGGAILIGKTTTPEFGGLGVTDSPLTGVTNNPWRLTHTAGGSSGGAAASMAAGVGYLAWGSDGGGSIRIPAACCGVVGLKASRGRFPVPTPWETVSTEGPLTRTVVDSALMLAVASGPHVGDPLCLPLTGEDFVSLVLANPTLTGKRIAFAPAPAGAMVDHEVAAIVANAVQAIADADRAWIDEVELDVPDPVKYFADFWPPSFTMMGAEDAGALVDDAVSHPVTVALADRGRQMMASDHYRTATVTRSLISQAFNHLFADHDLIITPTMPLAAFPHPLRTVGGNTEINGLPVSQPHIDFHRFTESPSHAGLPAITVPCGFSKEGLPVGLQIIGPLFADAAVLAAAAAIERILPWSQHRPKL